MHRRSRHDRGFTLVELLVVIGIIAVLIGVLLPVLSGIAARGRDLKCQSNIRQVVQLALTYAAENKGQLPYAYYFSPRGQTHWWSVGADPKVISAWSIMSHMSSRSYSIETREFNASSANAPNDYAPFLRCPEALQVRSHLCSYVLSMTAFVSPLDEMRATAVPDGLPWKKLIDRPTKTTQCLPFTALVWDSAVLPFMATRVGFIIGGDIDAQRIWVGAVHPQYRFYSPRDPFGWLLPGIFGNNRPVRMDDPRFDRWYNIDPPEPPQNYGYYPYQGNLRFRHRKNTTCNVGYADGHVGQFTGKFKSDGTPISHDAIRKSFMVKWPSGTGIAPDPSLPH